MSLEAYKVAVNISLVENVTRGLMMMSRHFRTTDMEAKALETRLKSIGKMALAGGALAAVGGFGLGLLKGPIEEAIKYQTELARFGALGFGAKINAQADEYARGMHTIGTSTRENMALVGDAMAVFKNLDHAKMAAPLMARMKFANQVLFGEGGGDRDRKLMDMLKVIEFRGGLSSNREFATQADFAQKAIAGSRGRVDASALLAALKTGGVALSRRNNDAFYLGGEPLIQEFGGARYGTAAMSIYQNLVQSRGTITAQQELFRLGLLDPSRVQFNKLGMLKKALPGSFKGSSILENEGELALLHKVLLPAFAAKGITGDEATVREFGMILGNRTGSGLMSRIYQQDKTGSLGRQIAANQHALGVKATEQVAANTPAGKLAALRAREATLELHIGDAALPMFVKGLEMVSRALDRINAFASAHPAMFDGMVKMFAAVSAAALVGGGMLLVTSGFRALALLGPMLPMVGTAFTVIAAALPYIGTGLMVIGRALLLNPIGLTLTAIAAAVYLVWKNWDWIGPKLTALWEGIKNGVAAMINYVIGMLNHLPGVNISPIGQTAPGGTVPMHRPAASQQKTGDVYLDGHKVGAIVAAQLARQANRPNSGGHFYDNALGKPSMLITK